MRYTVGSRGEDISGIYTPLAVRRKNPVSIHCEHSLETFE
jgi:hypothetical protein